MGTMKTIVAVLSDSPFYFTMPLRDRYGLVKRLVSKKYGHDQEIDLTTYVIKVNKYLNIEEFSLTNELCRFSPFDQESID